MRRGPDSRALGISLALHAVVLVPLVVLARPPEPIQFETYRVNLVAAPAVHTRWVCLGRRYTTM